MKKGALLNSKNEILVPELAIATSFCERGNGLLGRQSLTVSEGLWIVPCWNIHTCFMKFAIDCIFVNSDLRVLDIKENVTPWRFAIKWGAHSVIELAAGQTSARKIQIGDELHVRT